MASDLSLLTNIDLDHAIKTVKVCTNQKATTIVGVQVSYGKFDAVSGEVVSPVSMNQFGNLNDAVGICSVMYIPEKDYINKMIFQSNLQGINFLYISTAGSLIKNFGKTTTTSSN